LLATAGVTPGQPADEQGKVIAAYGDAVSRAQPPPGWSFLWNAGKTADDPAGFAPMTCVEVTTGRRKAGAHGIPDEAGGLRADRPSHSGYGDVFALRDRDGTARWAIAAYTLQEDSAGDVWIHNGNLLNRSYAGGCALDIRVNQKQLFQAVAAQDRAPLIFQKRLGRLKRGDVVRVAVGPGEKADKAGGRLRYTLEDWPPGRAPGEPVNILCPPITAAEPQRDADGRFATYQEKHRAQCEIMLADKPELVLIGDSITARWPAELLQQKYGKRRPVNLGIGGDWIQNVLWRVRNGVWDQLRIKVAVLLIGTNNLSNRFTPEEVAQGTAGLLKAIHEKTPETRILLLGILPRGGSVLEPVNEKVRLVNSMLAAMADGKRVFYLDVGPALLEKDGSIQADVMPDKLHVAGPGYIRWMDAMAHTLDALLEMKGEHGL
jgi:beta-glucosidase